MHSVMKIHTATSSDSQIGVLLSCFSSQTVVEYLDYGLFRATFSLFCAFNVIPPIKMVPKYKDNALSVVWKGSKTVMYLMKKIHMSEQLPSGRIYSTVGLEFIVNESTIISSKIFLNSRHVNQGYVLNS